MRRTGSASSPLPCARHRAAASSRSCGRPARIFGEPCEPVQVEGRRAKDGVSDLLRFERCQHARDRVVVHVAVTIRRGPEVLPFLVNPRTVDRAARDRRPVVGRTSGRSRRWEGTVGVLFNKRLGAIAGAEGYPSFRERRALVKALRAVWAANAFCFWPTLAVAAASVTDRGRTCWRRSNRGPATVDIRACPTYGATAPHGHAAPRGWHIGGRGAKVRPSLPSAASCSRMSSSAASGRPNVSPVGTGGDECVSHLGRADITSGRTFIPGASPPG